MVKDSDCDGLVARLQVAARNTGTSYIKGMEERAATQGAAEGKVRMTYACPASFRPD